MPPLDGFGSERAVTNASQGVTASLTLSAFGQTVASTGSSTSAYQYGATSGYRAEGDAGLMLLGHRYYDASVGRFLTADPAKAGDNWYAYCNDNPLKGTDPQGLCVAVIGLLPLLPVPGVGEIVAGVIIVVVVVVVVATVIDDANNGGWYRGTKPGQPPTWDKPERPIEKDLDMDGDTVLPGKGPSITTQPGNLPRPITEGHPIGELPPELEIIPKGNDRDPGHGEIAPRAPMPLQDFKDLLPDIF